MNSECIDNAVEAAIDSLRENRVGERFVALFADAFRQRLWERLTWLERQNWTYPIHRQTSFR